MEYAPKNQKKGTGIWEYSNPTSEARDKVVSQKPGFSKQYQRRRLEVGWVQQSETQRFCWVALRGAQPTRKMAKVLLKKPGLVRLALYRRIAIRMTHYPIAKKTF